MATPAPVEKHVVPAKTELPWHGTVEELVKLVTSEQYNSFPYMVVPRHEIVHCSIGVLKPKCEKEGKFCG